MPDLRNLFLRTSWPTRCSSISHDSWSGESLHNLSSSLCKLTITVCNRICRYHPLMAIDQHVWPTYHLPLWSLRNLCVLDDCRLHQSRLSLQLERVMGHRGILARLHLHIRLDRWTFDL